MLVSECILVHFIMVVLPDIILQGEALLVATGRKPNTSALNVAATGVELDEKGYIKIDD